MGEDVRDVDVAFSTQKLLPDWDDVPTEFRNGNVYTELAENLQFGRPLPDMEIRLNPGVDAAKLNRVVRAHLDSYGPKHEHKIAGVGFMISQLSTLHPNQ